MRSFIYILLIASVVFSQRNPWSISLDPSKPEAGEEFTFVFTIQKNKIPPGAEFPQLEGLPKGAVIETTQKDGVQRGFFTDNIAVRQYLTKLKVEESGKYPVKLVWKFQGQKNYLGEFDLPIARSLDASALSIFFSGVPDTLYVGEQFKLGIHYNAYDNLLSGPSMDKVDFGLEFLGNFREKSLKWQASTNPKYRMQLTQEAYLAPLKAGKLEIPEMEFSYLKQGRPQRKTVEKKMGNSYFSSTTIVNEPIESVFKTKAQEITVIATPEKNKPRYYKDMVGDFTWKVTQHAQQLVNGDPLKIEVQIEGDGKPEYIVEPHWDLPPIWNQGEPEIQKKSWVSGGKLKTSKTWTWYLYPTRSGDLNLGEIEFAYFNPKDKKYHSLNHVFDQVKVEGVVEQMVKIKNPGNPETKVLSQLPVWENNAQLLLTNPFEFVAKLRYMIIGVLVLGLLLSYSVWFFPSFRNPDKRVLRSFRNAIAQVDFGKEKIEKTQFEKAWVKYFQHFWNLDWNSETHEAIGGKLKTQGIDSKLLELVFEIDDLWNRKHYSESKLNDSAAVEQWNRACNEFLQLIQLNQGGRNV